MNVLFYVALVLLAINILFMFVMYLKIKDRFSRDRILGDIRTEVDRLIVDLGRETDRDVAILEDRIRGLKELMEQADRRILLADREEVKRSSRPVIPESPAVKPQDPPAQKNVNPSSESGQGISPSSNTEEPIKIYTRPVITRKETQLEPEVPLVDRVLAMARKDLSPEIIAKKVGISLGEVDLILTMNSSSL